MKHLKLWSVILLALFLGGCVGSSNYYVLSLTSAPTQRYTYVKKPIGVEKVNVPAYLFKREIAIAKSASKIGFISGAEWGEDLDEGLTNRLISTLQKKFNTPEVYAFPWEIDRVPQVKVKVNITRFIAYGSYVYLDADWELKSPSKRRVAKLFTTRVAIASNSTESIVSAMDVAFKQLEEDIARGMVRF